MRVAAVGNGALARHLAGPSQSRQVKAVDGVEEEERPHPLVEVLAAVAEGLEGGRFGEQVRYRRIVRERVERLVANGRVERGDDLDEAGHSSRSNWKASEVL